jgi:membrane-associated phospholipid phosphatase
MRRIVLPPSVDAFDARFDRFWDRFRGNRALDALFYTASEVGDFGMVWMAMAGVQGAFGPPEQTRQFLRVAGVLGAESIIVNGGLKSLFRRERPMWDQERPMHLRKPKTSSFPSGHSSSAVTAAILLTNANRTFAPLWWSVAAVVALSRVHVKIHHVSDVLGGLVAGAVIGTAALALLPIG